MTLRGTLQGHGGWVTQIATNPQFPNAILSASRADNRQIVSASRDKTIKLWNTLGVCKYTVQNPIIVSCGWDRIVKVWNLTNCKLKTNPLWSHTTPGYRPPCLLMAHCVPQDGQAMLWDLNEGKHLYTLDGGDSIRAMCFSPNRYWLCAATGASIKIWDLEGKVIVDELIARCDDSWPRPCWDPSSSKAWVLDAGNGITAQRYMDQVHLFKLWANANS
nr:hypothetical protein BaRGS_014021 [Batillaria attramentaria]